MDVILLRDGVVENVIAADDIARAQRYYPDFTPIERTPALAFVSPGYTFDGTTWTAPPEPTAPVVDEDRRVTKLRFQLRFTDAEAIGIDLASQGNTVQAASIRRYLTLIELAEWIDLNNPLVRAGVMNLAAGGLLTTERATEILDAPVSDDERPA